MLSQLTRRVIRKLFAITFPLLPIFGKIFERLVLNSLFEFLHENNLLNENE